jgi:hypothetical protein
MIIQAGFDLEFLARLQIVPLGEVLPRLVLIAVDADMQLADISVATRRFDGRLEPHFDSILGRLDPETTRYFAIAHAGCWSECLDTEDPVLQDANALRNWPSSADSSCSGISVSMNAAIRPTAPTTALTDTTWGCRAPWTTGFIQSTARMAGHDVLRG